MNYMRNTAPRTRLAAETRSQTDSTAFHGAVLSKAYPERRAVSSGTPIFADDGRRRVCVGYLCADGIFSKRVKPSHVLQRPGAIAVQQDVLTLLERQGCHTVEVTLIESGKVLRAPLRLFATHGIRLNRGYGLQLALPMKYWQDAADPQGNLFGGDE